MRTRIFTLLVAFLAIAGNAVWGQGQNYTFPGGNGTANAPYQLSTEADLKAFQQLVEADLNKENARYSVLCAKLMNDIVVSGNWEPIGKVTTTREDVSKPNFTYYCGTFDGDGHTITFSISSTDAYQGLFGHNGGTIKNLRVDGSISCPQYAGGIAARNRGTIENCTNSVDITITSAGDEGDESGYAGGICGKILSETAKVVNCVNEGTIKGYGRAGGICGNATNNSSITGCANTGNVSATPIEGKEEANGVGAICGYSNIESISDCISTVPGLPITGNEKEGEETSAGYIITPVAANGHIDYSFSIEEESIVVTFQPIPNNGYLLESVNVTGGEKEIELTYHGDGTYSFTMPDANVTITATFRKESKPVDIDRPKKYYNIYVDTICPGLNVEVSKDVVQEGHQVSAYLTIQSECDTTGMRFEYKRGLFGYWKDLKELEGVQPGEYIIKNIYTDIYIRALDATLPEEEPTGIDELEGVKAYAKDGSIYVYTPNREEVTIISMSGAIIKHAEQVGMQSYSVSRGIYIVRIGEKVFKLKN